MYPLLSETHMQKYSASVMLEAKRLARQLIKDELGAVGIKLSQINASELHHTVNELLEADPAIFDRAKANLEGISQ